MILIPAPLLKVVVDAAEAAYPGECCGLLVGRTDAAASVVVTRVEPSPNRSQGSGYDSFEVDPELRFRVMRDLEGTPHRIIGHYHSHPDHPAQPSRRDLESAWEPDLVWLITSVVAGQAVQTTAHAVDADGRQFREIGLRTTDWQLYPERPAPEGG